MEASIPQKMKYVHSKGKGKKLEVLETDMPTPGEGEVLLQVVYSTINPSDMMALDGEYPTGKDPNDWVPGLEGCGIVVQPGGNVTLTKGTKVGFYANKDKKFGGAWCEYSVIKADMCIEFPKDYDMKLAAGPIVNPLTAHTMLQEIQKRGYQCIVQTAAASHLCKMRIRACKAAGVKTINIVRKEEHVKMLQEMGADVVLNSEEKDFMDQYKKAVEIHKPMAIFDAVAGKISMDLLRELPQYAVIYIYGALESKEVPKVAVDLFIFHNKEIRGFHLKERFQHHGGMLKVPSIEMIPDLLKTLYRTDFGKEYSLDEINDAISDYKKHMSAGKALINPWKVKEKN